MDKPCFKPVLLGITLLAIACMTVIALYGIVFDAGSTHTSLFLYQWPGNKENNTGIVSQKLTCDVKGDGISSYVTNPPDAGQSLKECIDVAMTAIPPSQLSTTPVYLGATAGMRLLMLENQTQAERILAEVTKAIQSYPFDFRGARILTGMEEGAYGWITINYLLEGFIKYAFDGRWVHPKSGKIQGALDLGGASAQISFTPKDPVKDPGSAFDLQLYGYRYQLYTYSYLCYGKDQALKMLQAYLHMVSAARPSSVVQHPCYHRNYSLTLKLGELYNSPCVVKPLPFDPALKVTFLGTGDSQLCLSLMKSIINLTDCSFYPDCGFNGVYQPPVNGEFFVSVFPKLKKMPLIICATLSYLTTYCFICFQLVLEYPKVKETYLRDYCAFASLINEVNLIFSVLVIFTLQAEDNDIGWTLGYMLNLTNLISSDRPLVITGVQHSQWAAEVFFIVFVLFLSILILIVLCAWGPKH
uniref:Ectonucleoside triphosphate diphosphohydrolase 8 n=1 Tax=Electrophorus electricus TaxID=8005 RepID=A0A4W4F064_ELEEL